LPETRSKKTFSLFSLFSSAWMLKTQASLAWLQTF
jgi:hypothetical protein